MFTCLVATQQKEVDHTNLMWIASVALYGTLIPIIVLIIINTISNLPVYEIQLLQEFDNTHRTSGTCNYACLFMIHKLALT